MNDVLKYLPQMLTGKELDNSLAIFPKYDSTIRERSIPERLVALQDIYKIYVPSKMTREIYTKMYLSLLRSLHKKQSILAIRQFGENSRMIRNQSYESIIGGSDSFTIIGESGIGKSSAVSRVINVLANTPIIEINNTKIIPCLQVQAPADSSIKGLLFEILRKIDEVLETRYHENAIRSHSTTDMLIGTVSQVALNHIGLLIVDEIQNVVNNKNGKTVIGTLIQLINNSGVSICMVGTPESVIFFDQAMMLARRSLGLNYTMMEYGEEFREFCKVLLRYCYVQNLPQVDEQMLMWLYNHSSGNASVVVGLIHDAQEIAILNGFEMLDITTLTNAYNSRMTMLHDYITPRKAKSSQAKKKHAEKYILTENLIDDNISIFEISTRAKTSGCSIVSELMKNEILILEVDI